MKTQIAYRPVRFFAIAFLVTWVCEFIAIYLSYQQGAGTLTFLCVVAGLFGPLVAALITGIGTGGRVWWEDYRARLSLKAIHPRYYPAIFLVMPGALFAATAVSLLFGLPADQFLLTTGSNVLVGQAALSMFMMFLAPTLEELGWRGYGVDSLKSNHSVFKTTLVYSVLWAVWHLPLFFINGYYHQQLLQTNVLFAANWFVEVPAQALLMNWIYFRNNRSITSAILIHIVFDVFSELFRTEQFTKCIFTVILIIVDVVIILRSSEFFFQSGRQDRGAISN